MLGFLFIISMGFAFNSIEVLLVICNFYHALLLLLILVVSFEKHPN
ncbi:hypothetical protein RINTHH_20700 [Richelia intracellularis HH01]|uniref:Uncharacterized protein n=1 Tax=Richelia intracellularis HH01 TaxID=1165094 RepID=M1X3A3_9NOST|nr:hypothetical protein RINTHH_20700 [Richelia intracellularis HH01]